jgi:hypothetical protein
MARRRVWTVEQIRALGAATNLATAAGVLGIGRTLAYELVAAGQFPVPVIRAGTRVIVPVAPLLRLLHADDPDTAGPAGGRLDRGGLSSVDATTSDPADSPRRHRRADPDHEGEHR